MSSIEKKSEGNYERERNPDIAKQGSEQLEKLREDFESKEQPTDNRESDTTAARQKALEHASSQEAAHTPHKQETSPAERRGPITKKQLDANFDHTMKYVREDLSGPSQVFSKLIHNKAVEKTSDIVGSTIARPNALLTGAICAFVLTLILYVFAKNMGYRLSGFEPVGAFLIGWLIGQLYDYFRVMITGKK